jgi:hypothetical protein
MRMLATQKVMMRFIMSPKGSRTPTMTTSFAPVGAGLSSSRRRQKGISVGSSGGSMNAATG